jgi:hypothetical protein
VIIGYDKGHFETEHRANFTKMNLEDAKANLDMKAQSKEGHLQIGGSYGDALITVYQDEYRRDQNNKSKLFHKDY